MADGVVSLALIGGDDRLARELAGLAAQLGDVALLPEAASDRADALLVADGRRGAALDLLRIELASHPARRVLLVGVAGTIEPAEAMACGARGVLELPLSAARLRTALAAAGCVDERTAAATDASTGPIVLLGATGGCGTTTCAVAIASATLRSVLVDLDLGAGDAAAVAAAPVESPDALLALAHAPGIDVRELVVQLADGPSARVLPAPALPEQADLVDESGVAQVLEAIGRAGLRAVVDAGSRVGVETLPALERASALALVCPVGAHGRRGVVRLAGLLYRLGLADRPVGIVASRVWPHQRAEAKALAELAGLPLWASVPQRPTVLRAAGEGRPPPVRPFAGLALAVANVVAR